MSPIMELWLTSRAWPMSRNSMIDDEEVESSATESDQQDVALPTLAPMTGSGVSDCADRPAG